MKTLLILCVLLLQLGCAFNSSSQYEKEDMESIFVIDIDSTLISNYYYIRIKNLKNKKEGILLSPFNLDENCEVLIKKGEKHFIILNLLTSTEEILDFSFRLYQNDIYVDGENIFPSKTKVHISTSMDGLCLKYPLHED